MKLSFDNYYEWTQENLGVDLAGKPSTIYQFVIQKIQSDITKCQLWVDLQGNLLNYNDEYYLASGYPLLKNEPIPLFAKTYESLINKTYRKNILLNDEFPNPPSDGWISPQNWFVRIKDLIRTTITVRYLDGVEFIVNKIKDLAEQHNFGFKVDYEAREEGYYAAHITIVGKFKVVDDEWNETDIDFPIEIQVTTQLQEVIKGLLHKMYEEFRITPVLDKEKKWQWNHQSLEFRSNYLGHILHYVEGMILEVRDKQRK